MKLGQGHWNQWQPCVLNTHTVPFFFTVKVMVRRAVANEDSKYKLDLFDFSPILECVNEAPGYPSWFSAFPDHVGHSRSWWSSVRK